MENEDVIRQQMEETRESITDKLETLEKKLSESVEEVTTVVTTAKETVHESVEAAKDFMDVKAHVQRHPWLMASGAVACGYVLGSILAQEKRAAPAPSQPVRATQPTPGNGRHKQEKPAAQETSHWWSAFAPELDALKSMALGAVFSGLRDIVTAEVPPPMKEQVRTFFDKVTQKMGADPLPAPEPMTAGASCSSSSQTADEGSLDLEKPRW